jgi:hypothetical protein
VSDSPNGNAVDTVDIAVCSTVIVHQPTISRRPHKDAAYLAPVLRWKREERGVGGRIKYNRME